VTGLFLFPKPLLKLRHAQHQRPRTWAHVLVVVEHDAYLVKLLVVAELVLLADAEASYAVGGGAAGFADVGAGFGCVRLYYEVIPANEMPQIITDFLVGC